VKRPHKRKPAPGSASTGLKSLPESALRAIEADVERRFFPKALALMSDERWGQYGAAPHGALLAVRDLALAYAELLEWAFVEYVALLQRITEANQVAVQWRAVEKNAFHFAERFITGAYWHPFTGNFLTSSQSYVSKELAVKAFTRMHEIVPWISVAPGDWERIFFGEVRTGPWRDRAIQVAKDSIELAAHTSATSAKSESPDAKRHRASEVPPWQELRKRKSISRLEAASFLGWAEKTIRNRFKDQRLSKTPNGRVACDDKLLIELRKEHGAHYR
jgi:hypothetical protein